MNGIQIARISNQIRIASMSLNDPKGVIKVRDCNFILFLLPFLQKSRQNMQNVATISFEISFMNEYITVTWFIIHNPCIARFEMNHIWA